MTDPAGCDPRALRDNSSIRKYRMSRCLLPSIVVVVLVQFSISSSTNAADVYFATWNVENLFDDVKDGRHDREVMEWWNTKLYRKKLDRLAAVISKMNDGKGPDVLALVEVENRKVLKDLVKKLPKPESYRIVHYEGKAGRGIEVALITRLDVANSSSHFVYHGIREILRVDLKKNGHQLTVLVNHWKSRFGGTLPTSTIRTICAARAFQLYWDIVRKSPDADVLLCGDFNDGIRNVSVKEILFARESRLKVERQTSRKALYNCTTEIAGKGKGTYYYDYEWSYLDQIIVSRGMIVNPAARDGFRYKPKSIQVFNPGGMLTKYNRPWRFGNQYTMDKDRGYSDHLPLTAVLQVPDRR